MNSAPPSPRAPWRDFLNRREPGARGMLAFLVLLLTAEIVMLFCYNVDQPIPAAPGRFIPLLLTLAAIATCRWWSLPCAPAFADPRYEVPPSARRWVWLMAGAVAILSMWPRSARLDHSLSTNEVERLDTARANSRQHHHEQYPHGSRLLVIDRVAAQVAAQTLISVPQPPEPTNPRTARAVPWTAGVLGAGLVVLLAAALGSLRAGLAAGLIAAMHPQFVQWSSEVTDASLGQFFFGAALLCLLQAMRTNAWRWWSALAAAQVALCFGHPMAAIFTVPVLNIIAALVIRRSTISPKEKTSHALRLFVVTACAASTMAIPSSYITTFQTSPAIADQWANFLSGVPFTTGGDVTGSSLLAMTHETVWRWPVLFILLPLVILAGFWFLLRHDWRTRLVAGAFIISLPGFSLFDRTAPTPVLLPVVLVWAGVGLSRLFPRQRRLLHAPVFIAVLYVIGTAPALQRTISIPRQPLREVLTATYTKPSATVAAFGFGPHYQLKRDSGVHNLEKPSELDALIDAAFDKSLPLFVFHALADGTDARFTPLAHKLQTSGQFSLIKEFAAFDPRENIRLYKYQPREQIIRLNVTPEKK